jgi:CheY-like chemotaxis protein
LIVEDNESDQLFIEQALRDNGVEDQIRIVGNYEEAVAYLNGESKFADRRRFPFPALMITDVNMPGGTGLGLLTHLKNNPRANEVHTIVLSSAEDPVEVSKAQRLGANGFHLKPGSYLELRTLLKRVCDTWYGSAVREPVGTPT